MIYGIDSATTGLTGTSSNNGSKEILGKDDFLKMLLSQLSNQDPLNPMESTDFSAQLAQFSSVEQLGNISDSLEDFINSNYLLATSVNNTLASNVIGKNIKALGDQVYYNGDSTKVHFNLSAFSKDVEVKIYDQNGNLVRTLQAEDVSENTNGLTWDGKDENGVEVQQGAYRFEVSATDANGEAVQVETYVSGEVTGIRYDQNGAVLLIGDIAVNFGDVLEIFSPDNNGENG